MQKIYGNFVSLSHPPCAAAAASTTLRSGIWEIRDFLSSTSSSSSSPPLNFLFLQIFFFCLKTRAALFLCEIFVFFLPKITVVRGFSTFFCEFTNLRSCRLCTVRFFFARQGRERVFVCTLDYFFLPLLAPLSCMQNSDEEEAERKGRRRKCLISYSLSRIAKRHMIRTEEEEEATNCSRRKKRREKKSSLLPLPLRGE